MRYALEEEFRVTLGDRRAKLRTSGDACPEKDCRLAVANNPLFSRYPLPCFLKPTVDREVAAYHLASARQRSTVRLSIVSTGA
jgi:hypothetical protein